MRIACPSCDAALTVSERGAGKVLACPKCGQPMKVPDSADVQTSPPVQPIVFAAPPLPPPTTPPDRAEKPPRKRWDDDDESPIRKKPKRRKRPPFSRKPPPTNLGPWILLGVLVLLAIVSLIVAIVLFRSRSAAEDQRPRAEPLAESPEPSAPAEKPVRNITYGPLPAGWSYNSPTYGFKAAWPVEPGSDKYAPADAFSVTMADMVPNSWSLVIGSGDEPTLILGVTRIVLPEEMAIDGIRTLKNYLPRLQQAAGPNATARDCTVDGQPGYEIVGARKGARFVQRATILDNVIWTVDIQTSQPANASEEIANRFLDSFIPFPGG